MTSVNLFCFLSLGLTETCAGSFVSLPNNMSMLGTVGPPVPYVEARLESVPEMGYDALSSESPRGEICIRGDTLFSGYYKREDLTKEVLVDGWFHTGMDFGALALDRQNKLKLTINPVLVVVCPCLRHCQSIIIY